MFKNLIFSIVLLPLTLSASSAPIGIITPLNVESEPIIETMTQIKEVTKNQVHYLKGKLYDNDIVLTRSGMGIANISFITSRMIQDFQPKQIFLLGSSGAISSRVKKGGVVLGKNVTNVDFGKLTDHGVTFPFIELLKHPQSKKMQPLNFKARISCRKKINPSVILGKIATSEMLPNSRKQVSLLKQSGYDIVEMEGAGFMQICWFYHSQCLVIRGVSNSASEPITMEDVKMSAKAALSVLIQCLGNSKKTQP